MHNRRTIQNVLILVLFVAAIVTSFLMYSGKGQIAGLSGPNIFGAQSSASKERLSGVGAITSISGQDITFTYFTVLPPSGAPQNATPEKPKSMTVTVVASTVIERITPKDPDTLTKERDAFTAQLAKLQAAGKLNETTMPKAPEPFTLKKLALSDLSVGDSITVYSATDISNTDSFTATKIDLFNLPKR